MIDLSRRVALVTGASRGIGQATAVALAHHGADVALAYREFAGGAEETRIRVEALGRRATVLQADVTDAAQVNEMAAAAERDLGPVDILVNNAGWARRQSFEEITEADWDAVLETNLKSVFLVTGAVLPRMRQRKWGRIINISSGAAATGGVVGLHYTAAKAGMEGLTRAYAKLLVKEGITVNTVAPTMIDTGPGRDHAARAKIIPMGRVGRPEEIADAVVLCAGTGYMTGQVLHLNGGLFFH